MMESPEAKIFKNGQQVQQSPIQAPHSKP